MLRADPWRLLALPDAAVAQADRLARSIEPDVRRDDPRRGRALVEWTLARYARDGHTAAPQSLVADGLRPFGVDAQPALGAALVSGGVVRVADPAGSDEPWIAREVLAQAESTIAEGLARLVRTASTLAGERAVKGAVKGLDDVQAGAVSLAAAHGVSLLTGGPGTGKIPHRRGDRRALPQGRRHDRAGRADRAGRQAAGGTGRQQRHHGAPVAGCPAAGRRARPGRCSTTTPTTRSRPSWWWSTRRRCWTSNWPPR